MFRHLSSFVFLCLSPITPWFRAWFSLCLSIFVARTRRSYLSLCLGIDFGFGVSPVFSLILILTRRKLIVIPTGNGLAIAILPWRFSIFGKNTVYIFYLAPLLGRRPPFIPFLLDCVWVFGPLFFFHSSSFLLVGEVSVGRCCRRGASALMFLVSVSRSLSLLFAPASPSGFCTTSSLFELFKRVRIWDHFLPAGTLHSCAHQYIWLSMAAVHSLLRSTATLIILLTFYFFLLSV